MKKVGAKLRNVEFYFLRMHFVQVVQVCKHLFLVLSSVQGQYHGEYLVLLIGKVGLQFTSLPSGELLSQCGTITFYKCSNFSPTLFPVILVNDLIDETLEVRLRQTLTLLLHFDVLGVVLCGELD